MHNPAPVQRWGTERIIARQGWEGGNGDRNRNAGRDWNENEDGSGDKNRDGGGNRRGNGDDNREEGGREKEPGSLRCDNSSG